MKADLQRMRALAGVPLKEAAVNHTECPECGSDDIDRVHHEGSFAIPECWYFLCHECDHQWDHS